MALAGTLEEQQVRREPVLRQAAAHAHGGRGACVLAGVALRQGKGSGVARTEGGEAPATEAGARIVEATELLPSSAYTERA